jgi:hypothetical protein
VKLAPIRLTEILTVDQLEPRHCQDFLAVLRNGLSISWHSQTADVFSASFLIDIERFWLKNTVPLGKGTDINIRKVLLPRR